MKRFHFEVIGKVQGVGFRPYVYRIAKRWQLTGFVFNQSKGVTIEIQGDDITADQFEEALKQALPSLAVIDTIKNIAISPVLAEEVFSILHSPEMAGGRAKISPDSCICDDCLDELFDPISRYYRYPFLNCTNCGPRFTIVRSTPYDRQRTTMDVFPLCDDCAQDYQDPEDRRYHAQPTACSKCGPQLSSSVESMVEQIKAGKILAIKGLGGYQLVCDACNDQAVSTLRQRKKRKSKPFAVMALNRVSIEQLLGIRCGAQEAVLLESKARPIVLLTPDQRTSRVSKWVAPELNTLGFMLPSTPLHYLLFHGLLGFPKQQNWLNEEHNVVLVVTSANLSHQPLITDDQVARDELSSIADHVIAYNRDIVAHVDDSVIQVLDHAPSFIRRARGYVPDPIPLSHEMPSILALGGQYKNTICLTRGKEAFVSQYIGDLDYVKTIQTFHEVVDYYRRFLGVKIDCVVHDRHPDFYTTRFARDCGLPTVAVQHHHAHLGALMAEYQLTEPVLGLALDGYGYGDNGEAWGGELLCLDARGGYTHLGGFRPIPLLGGDRTIKEPWRIAVGILSALNEDNLIQENFGFVSGLDKFLTLIKNGFYPNTSSCGRLFCGAAALLGIRSYADYEGQGAMELESLVTKTTVLSGGFQISPHQLDLLPLMAYLARCSDATHGANIFHGTLVCALFEWVKYWHQQTGLKTVLLSGGCFHNRVLSEQLVHLCRQAGLTPLLPHLIPPNDGGLSLGQAWVAGMMTQNK